MARWLLGALVGSSCVALAATMLSGCAVFGDGPLWVEDGNEICGYAGEDGSSVYFGVALDNQGNEDDAVILTARATETMNVASVELLVEDAKPIGSFRWPSESSDAVDAMDDAVAPGEDAVVAAGVYGNLLVAITPEDPESKARVDEIAITYRSGGHVHTVYSHLRIVLAPYEGC